jgi:hypothetical protein
LIYLARDGFPQILGGELLLDAAVLTTKESRPPKMTREDRYPLRLSVEFRFHGIKSSLPIGKAWTISISSRLILIEPDERIRLGQRLHLVIDWPARMDDRVPLRLHVTGRTVSADKNRLAVEIKKYEFRIAPSKSQAHRPNLFGSPKIALTAKIGSGCAR